MCFRNAVCAFLFAAFSYLSLSADGAKSKKLPPGIFKALAADEREYCDQFLGDFKKGCEQNFRASLLWHQLLIAPSGQAAILVESENVGSCGSAGCSLYLFVQQRGGEFIQVLGMQGDTGTLERIKVLKTVTKDHYNIQKTWADGKTHTIYQWNGMRYSAR
jgi:hypothetical protein